MIRKTTLTLLATVAMLSPNLAHGTTAACAGEDGAHLQARGEMFFNLYYFSDSRDVGRCANPQTAVADQLIAWLEHCDPDRVRPALRDLGMYASIPADEAGCGM